MIEKYLDRQYKYIMGLEKEKPKRKFPYWILAAVIMAVAIIYFSSCNSQKHIVKEKQSVDSSYVKELSDSVRILRTTNEKLEQTINEMQYAGVTFDTVYSPGRVDTIINTVIVTKEGEIKASGHISSAYVSKTVLINVLKEKNEVIDSFSLALEKEKKNVKIETQIKTVDKKVKPKFLWAMILVSFILGAIFWQKLKRYIVPFISKLLKI